VRRRPARTLTRPSLAAALVAGVVGAFAACTPPAAAPLRPAPTSGPAADSLTPRTSGGTLGIPPFALADTSPDAGGPLAPLAYALADILTTDLARSRRVTVVERARLGEVLRELDLVTAGRVDSASAPRVGRLIQAQRLVMGRLTALPAGRDVRLGVQIADVAQGTLAQAVDATTPVADLIAAERALAFRLFDAMGVVLSPDERAAIEQRPTANLVALLAYGRGVRFQILGDYKAAEAEFRSATKASPGFTDAKTRAAEIRRVADAGVLSPVLVPGMRALDAAVGVTIDRLNRPLDFTTGGTTGTTTRTTDPTFGTSAATVVITVNRP
jgi:hypothetical protein